LDKYVLTFPAGQKEELWNIQLAAAKEKDSDAQDGRKHRKDPFAEAGEFPDSVRRIPGKTRKLEQTESLFISDLRYLASSKVENVGRRVRTC
jgi:hypothetical protein